MYSNRAARRFADLQKFLQNQITGLAAVGEKELFVVESSIRESGRIVQFQVQSDNCCHVILAKIIKVSLWRMARVAVVDLGAIVRTTKGDEFPRNNPIQIAIFNTLVILVFFSIEIVEIEKSRFDCFVDGIQAISQADGVLH